MHIIMKSFDLITSHSKQYAAKFKRSRAWVQVQVHQHMKLHTSYYTLRHIAHRVPESSRESRLRSEGFATRTHMSRCEIKWSACLNDSPWIVRRVYLVYRSWTINGHHCHDVHCRVVVIPLCIRASSVGQNGVNRPRDFKVISARGEFCRASQQCFTRLSATVYLSIEIAIPCNHPHFRAVSYMSYEDGMPAGGNSRFRGYPARMSERQQLALLLQMTSQEIVSGEDENK